MTEKTPLKAARKNTLTVALTLAALTLWNVHRHRLLIVDALGAAAVVLFLIVLFSPSWTERFSRGWMAAGHALGYVNSRILLSLVYYAVLTPLGMALRLFGHARSRRRDAPQKSHWIPRQNSRQAKIGFERPF